MGELPRLLLGSLVLRPYVFTFLLVHLLAASGLLGWRRTAVFTLITWGVAFAAEASSIRTGVPFGWYHYIPRTADRELWILGVPFFDSLSFSFLLVSSYGLAWFLLAGGRRMGKSRWPRPPRGRHLLLGAGLFVWIDVVIDPVALRGDRWFLGQIYWYPEPGAYFGVPLANFLGWGLVGLAATTLYQAWEGRQPEAGGNFRGRGALCPGLYFIVLAFTLGVTFAIGEWWLGLSGLLFMLPVVVRTLTILMDPQLLAGRPRAEGIQA